MLLRPGAGETITDRAERTIRILFAHELLDASWARYERGERGPGPHVHHLHTDAFYVLEGELAFVVGRELEPVQAPAGTLVVVPPGVVHGFANESLGRSCFLNFHAPSGGFAAFLRGERPGFDSFDPAADGGRPASDAIVSLPGEGERMRKHCVKAELEHLSVIELSFDPDFEGVDPHTHPDHVDAFYVLEGEVEFTLGEDDARAGPGTFVAVPPGARHGFRPAGSRIAFLNLHAPDSGFVGRLRR